MGAGDEECLCEATALYVLIDRPPAIRPPPNNALHSYGKAVPATVENFAAIAMGRAPGGVSYKGTKIVRVVENVLVQGGDVVSDDGTGAFSSFGGKNRLFRDENLGLFRHTRGVISMVNQGPDTNGCQFFITLSVRGVFFGGGRAVLLWCALSSALCTTRGPTQKPPPPPTSHIHQQPIPDVDGKNQVFGRVLDGMDLLQAIGQVEVNGEGMPVVPITIRQTGELMLQ